MIAVTFTKNFVAGSTLEGLTYDTIVEFAPIKGLDIQERVSNFVQFLEKHTVKPVKVAGSSSDYIVSNIEVINA